MLVLIAKVTFVVLAICIILAVMCAFMSKPDGYDDDNMWPDDDNLD